MSGHDDDERGKTVGVYDRPASADRNNLRLWIMLAAIAASAVGAYFFLAT